MKKIFTLAIAISMMSAMYGQKVNVTSTEFADDGDFVNNFVIPIGLSSNGNITWGYNPVGSLGYYNFDDPNNPVTWTEYTDADVYGIRVVGVPYDDIPLVSNYLSSFFVDLKTGEKTYMNLPDENLGLDAWDITADGKYVGCNITDDAFLVIPLIGERQEDGTFKYTYLEYDEYDAMGCTAQYTQVRHVSEDGKYIMGIQPDNRGMSGRLVVWTRQEDGTYKFSTPLDDLLYDFTCEKPGYTPEWDDYVTANPETEPEIFAEQEAKFNEAWDTYEINYDKFTRNRSNIEMFSTLEGTNGNKIIFSYNDYRTEEREGMLTPVIYDYVNNKITVYDQLTSSATAYENLPGGGDIIDDGFELLAFDNDGNQKTFADWFIENTNSDFTTVMSTGVPYFSTNGKSLLLVGDNYENAAYATLFRFDVNIFESVTTGIKFNVVDEISVNGSRLTVGNGRQAVAEVYSLNGMKCGSYTVNGSFDFNDVLAKGTYVIKINFEKSEPATMKMIIK